MTKKFSSFQVNTIYHDPSLGVNIEVVTVKIMYMDKGSVSMRINSFYKGGLMFKLYCQRFS